MQDIKEGDEVAAQPPLLSTAAIRNIIEKLRNECYRDSTRETYYRIRKVFNKFIVRLDDKPRNWEDRLVLFTAHLISCNLKSTSVRSYISAIKGVLAENQIQISEDTYLLSSLTRACKLKKDTVVTRLPIRKDMLFLILKEVEKYFGTQPYLMKLHKAMLSSAYFGLLRIGEITCSPHAILAQNVHMGINKNKVLFVLNTSKTHTKGSNRRW